MRNTKVLGRASLDEQNLAPESGNIYLSLSLSLSGTAPGVSRHRLESTVEREFSSPSASHCPAECCVWLRAQVA